MSVSNPRNPILVVDDETTVLKSFEFSLRSQGWDHIVPIQDSTKVQAFLENNPVELILLDLTMPNVPGTAILKFVSENYPEIPVIVVTGLNDVKIAVECMKMGAADYLLKPVERSRLGSAVEKVIELRELKRQFKLLKSYMLEDKLCNAEAFSEIITKNRRLISIFRYLESVAQTREPILITGDTGTGKELMARAIYRLSELPGNFVPVNVAGLDDQMFSDTLFGHLKGAFTDAQNRREGLVEQAAEGILFLDEIGDLPPQSQVKLLRLIQEREYYPLGADLPKKSNARVIVATNQDLKSMMDAGSFRKDLYFRLSVHQVNIPRLKDRREDIPLLVDHFLEMAAQEMDKPKPTPPEELFVLLNTYHFPGNIRELRSMVYDAVSQHQSKILSLETFRRATGMDPEGLKKMTVPAGTQGVFSEIDQLPTIRLLEQQLIEEAMRRAENNQSIAARLLGITRQTLNSKLKKIKI